MKNQSNDSHHTGDNRFNTAGPTIDDATTNHTGRKENLQFKGKFPVSGDEIPIKKDVQ